MLQFLVISQASLNCEDLYILEAVNPDEYFGPRREFEIILLKKYSAAVCENTMHASMTIIDSKLVKL